MNILSRVTKKMMLENKSRTIVTLIGVILSAALFTAVVTAAVSGLDYVIRGTIYEDGNYHVGYSCLTEEETAQLQSRKEVTDFADFQALGYAYLSPDGSPMLLAACNGSFFESLPIHLNAGRLPGNSSELLIPSFCTREMELSGYPHEIGESITLNLTTEYTALHYDISVPQREFTKTFTIVGTADYWVNSLWLSSALTVADGSAGTPMWHDGYVKLNPASLSYDPDFLSFGMEARQNGQLLQFMGQTKSTNLNDLLFAIVAVLCAIIMVGSVSLIYNAFSISVAQRTRQFGLLSSVGATKKQLRSSVLYEAGILCAVGIPLGLLLGWVSIAVVLRITGGYIETLFSFSVDGPIRLQMVFSLPALRCAALVALVTVFLSAWIPARRATKVTPLEAIRRTDAEPVNPKRTKVSKLTYRLFGLSGALAKKYFSVSRKKYRATVLSLAISVILFLSAISAGDLMGSAVQAGSNTENSDMDIAQWQGDPKVLETLREQDFVKQSAYWYRGNQYSALIPDEMYTDEMLEIWDELYRIDYHFSRSPRTIALYYLEDEVLEQYLKEEGIDPSPYFDKDCPTALLCNLSAKTFIPSEDGRYTTQVYPNIQVLKSEVQSLPLFPYRVPEELTEKSGCCIWLGPHPGQNRSDKMIFRLAELPDDTGVCYQLLADSETEDGTVFGFYEYDPETDTAAEASAATISVRIPDFRLGARIIDLPFGITSDQTTGSRFQLSAILPAPCLPDLEETEDFRTHLSVSVSDYAAAKRYLENTDLEVIDYLADEQNIRGLKTALNVFAYGFILVISLICVANVFNTISTNIALRRRDFGMLKSVGMPSAGIRRMMLFECLIYGTRALIWGLPVGLVIHFLMHLLSDTVVPTVYALPLPELAVCIGSVFAVVLASMLYATRKLKQDNPIEAIRQENL